MYRYETHLHTAVSSACSRFLPEEIVEKYVRLGYRGVFVTDHFMRGNSSVPKSLAYEEQVSRYFDGYRAVKKCAEGSGLDVFYGIEISEKGTDFLFYGLDEKWYRVHPELMTVTPKEFCRLARVAGGFVVQAHPYREEYYIDHIRLFPSDVDGIEVINTANGLGRANGLSKTLAEAYGLIESAGSDIHAKAQKLLAGVEFENKITSEQDFAARMKKGEGRIFTLTDGEM